MFYRAEAYAPFDLPTLFETDTVRAVIGPYSATVNNDLAAEDTAAFMNYLDYAPGRGGAKDRHRRILHGRRLVAHARPGGYPDRVAATRRVSMG